MRRTRWIAALAVGVAMSVWHGWPAESARGAATPTCQGKPATIQPTPGSTTIVGTPRDDVIVGGPGNDTIRGKGGNDLICADADGDRPRHTAHHDLLFGGKGNDTLVGVWRYYGLASGGAGDDTFEFIGVTYADAPRAVTVDLKAGTASGWGHDTIVHRTHPRQVAEVGVLYGSRYNDHLSGGAENVVDSECGCDYIYGGAGNDVLNGRRGDDSLYGGHGNDVLKGGPGSDTLYPGLGRDRVVGGPTRDNATAYRPDDVSYAPLRRAVHIDLRSGVATGQGRDNLLRIGSAVGSGGADVIGGTDAHNDLAGGAGNDLIRGYAGSDVLRGDAGRDHLIGGSNHDWALGGPGNDACQAEKEISC